MNIALLLQMAAEACRIELQSRLKASTTTTKRCLKLPAEPHKTSVKVGAALSLCLIPQARLRQLR